MSRFNILSFVIGSMAVYCSYPEVHYCTHLFIRVLTYLCLIYGFPSQLCDIVNFFQCLVYTLASILAYRYLVNNSALRHMPP